MAERIQRSRTRGWRMPEGAVYVGRPSIWGNPWALGSAEITTRPDGTDWDAEDLVRWFRQYAIARGEREPRWIELLRDADLACWCPLDAPCHADVLLVLANG